MTNRNTLLIATASTLAVGMFGAIGAFYLEMFKSGSKDYVALVTVTSAALVLILVVVAMYLAVDQSIKNEEDEEERNQAG